MTSSDLTSAELDILDSTDDCTEEYGSLCTNRLVPRRAVLRLVAKGLVESIGLVIDRDDNDREKEGFRLTDEGARLLREARDM